MHDDNPPRGLAERTGRHYCITCLDEVPADTYLRNDHVCDACLAKEDERPLASTPEDKKPKR